MPSPEEIRRQEQFEDETRNMMGLVLARRRCHSAGHRGCKGHPFDVGVGEGADRQTIFIRCRPEKCSDCKRESTEAWESQRQKLKFAADKMLRRSGLVKRWDR